MSETPDYGEPWIATDRGVKDRHGDYPARGKAEWDRICACVSACAGLADPAAELATLREENERLREALEYAATVLDNTGWHIYAEDARAALRGPQPEEASDAR